MNYLFFLIFFIYILYNFIHGIFFLSVIISLLTSNLIQRDHNILSTVDRGEFSNPPEINLLHMLGFMLRWRHLDPNDGGWRFNRLVDAAGGSNDKQ